MIEFLDLRVVNAKMQVDIDVACLRVASSGRYVLGPEVEAFEAEWAAYCGVTHCIGTGNCLDALRLILMASGIGPGDEVIVAANTYIATWLAVSLVGATPVPVDADEASRNINPWKIENAITPRTVAIMPTHLYGAPAEMDLIRHIGAKHGLLVVADAAQAHGAKYLTRKAGSLADAEAFSFYPSKNLGGLGDGGCVTTNDSELAERIRRLRNYGGVGRLDHTVRGINSRLDEMQAAILRAKLPHLDAMNAKRAQRAAVYTKVLRETDLLLPLNDGNWHQYVVRTPRRYALRAALAPVVDCHVHYPVPPYLEPAYADMGIKRGAFPVAEKLADEVLSLPIGYDFDVGEVARHFAAHCNSIVRAAA